MGLLGSHLVEERTSTGMGLNSTHWLGWLVGAGCQWLAVSAKLPVLSERIFVVATFLSSFSFC